MLNFLLSMMVLAVLLIMVSALIMMFDIKEKAFSFFNFVLVLGICLFVISGILGLFFLF